MPRFMLPEDWANLDDDSLLAKLRDTSNIGSTELQILSNSSNWDVRELVEEIAYLDLPDDWKSLPDNEYIGDRLRDERIEDPVLLGILAKSSDYYVREAIASNIYTPKEVLEIISESDDDDLPALARQTLKRIELDSAKEQGRTVKTIELKSEPGGRLFFAKLEAYHIELLTKSLEAKSLESALQWLWTSGDIPEYSGVFSLGDDGEEGLVGRVCCIERLVENGGETILGDGFYYIYCELSKVSAGFELVLDKKEFDPHELEELSVIVQLPAEFLAAHQTYSDDLTSDSVARFNIITGFRYNGEDVESYDGQLTDRGYDSYLAIVKAENGTVECVYSSDGESDTWPE